MLVFSLHAKSLFSNNEQAENTKYLNALKNLVIATQKTRGLTNNYLNGNLAAMLLVYGTRDDIKKAIGEMESLPLASDTIIHERSAKISDALIKLNRKAFRKKPDVVFEEYTELIEQMLMLAQSVSKRGEKDLNPLGKKLVSVMMETILPLCEYTGQLRGMGAGIAAKGSITPEQKAHMTVLISQIQRLSSKLVDDLEELSSSNKDSCDRNINVVLKMIKKKTKDYVVLAQKEIISKEKIDYDSIEFFQKGTDLISLYIKVYDMNNKSMLKDSKGWL
jgi:hypothetical protein